MENEKTIDAINNIAKSVRYLGSSLFFISLWLFLMLLFKDMSSDCKCNHSNKIIKSEKNITIDNNTSDKNKTLPRV